MALTVALSVFSTAGPPPILQSQVKGLLVIALADGSHAGGASQMNATAVPASDETSFELSFNQEVGEMMESATKEVEKLMRVRHPDSLPSGHRIEFGFADKHSPKDGPSAAVACALMAESIITGIELDQKFAVTGDMTATGEVQPVGGVAAKVRGAARKDCEIFAVPEANRQAILDIYVLEGLQSVCDTQIVLITNLDEALALSRSDKSKDIAQAIEDFKLVSLAVSKNEKNAGHPKVIEKLKSILKALPMHESAKLVALHARGRGPKVLSLSGSLDAIDRKASLLASILEDGSFVDSGSNDALWESLSELKDLRRVVEPRTISFLDTYLDTASFLKSHRDKSRFTDQLMREWRSTVSKIGVERTKLLNDQDLQEELMDE